jgi:hypothetical protein
MGEASCLIWSIWGRLSLYSRTNIQGRKKFAPNISTYRHIGISTYWHIGISTYLHIDISTYLHIDISTYLHIDILAYHRGKSSPPTVEKVHHPPWKKFDHRGKSSTTTVEKVHHPPWKKFTTHRGKSSPPTVEKVQTFSRAVLSAITICRRINRSKCSMTPRLAAGSGL